MTSIPRRLTSAVLFWRRFIGDRSGNFAVFFALALMPMMVAVGFAVDYHNASQLRSRAQETLDAAVLAGIRQSTTDDQIKQAGTFFSAQAANYWGDAPTATFSVNGQGQLTGTAEGTARATFMSVLGIAGLPVKVAATAMAAATSRVCILLVNPSKSQSFLVNSGAVLNATQCEIHVLSTASPAAIFNSGSTLSVKRICIKGKDIINNGGGMNLAPETNCAAISDPFAKSMPKVSVGACNFNNQVFDPGNVTLQPGVYCGWTNFNGSGKLTLKPGLYVVNNGGMTFNSGWTVSGAGVTFYLVDQNATLTFNGNVNTTLSPPTSGTYANILMFEPGGLPNTNLPINGTNGSSIQGLLYLPSRDVTINSVSNVNADKTTMVFSSLIFNALNWAVAPGDLAMTTSGGTGSPRLVQ
ncbi:TadE/TadG family type IV pilus assembly protein [Mesorhizobium calcicola]|uniref:TadE/TadG family type IV pilus assembly protein n=1 Tax=Mesorhizobium calcicola TaxID=1300310 RepID=A0ABW4WBA9_9HYPH